MSFERILEPIELRRKRSSAQVKKAWAKRIKEGRTKRHPNQKVNYRGREGYK